MPNPIKIIPNTKRVLIKLLSQKNLVAEPQLLVPGQLKAGENLLYGEVVDGGDTKFLPGTFVYYSEYSASALHKIGDVSRGTLTLGEAMDEENKLYVVAEDDIMAWEQIGDGKSVE